MRRFCAVVLVLSCGGQAATQTVSIAPLPSPSATPAPLEATLEQPKRRADVVRIDKRVIFADCEWIIIEARDAGKKLSSNSEYNEETKKTDGRFILVHYKLTNLTKTDQMMLDRPKITDEKERAFDPVDMESFYVPAHAKAIGLDVLSPSEPKEYWTVIEVPADAERLRFRLHGFSLVGEVRSVDLGL